MSLLNAARVVSRPACGLRTVVGARFNSSESTPKGSAITTPPPTSEILAADTISGAPADLRHRVVRIYQPTRNTMQSGPGKTERWRIDFDTLPGSARWENPLMGYASSADYMQSLRMSFKNQEDAAHFAEKQGWDYYIQETPPKRIPPKNYAENYSYKPGTLRIMKTK